MAEILVCGHSNLETTVAVEQFPIEYTPMRYPFFGIQTAVAGVGYNFGTETVHSITASPFPPLKM
jgi:ribokinase